MRSKLFWRNRFNRKSPTCALNRSAALAGTAQRRACGAHGSTPYQLYPERTLGLPGAARRRIFLEPRGSRHLEFKNWIDMRVEKVFETGIHRFGVFADIYNVFNTAPVMGVQTRVPSTSISGYTVEFEAPTAIGYTRQVFFGGRWSF